MQFPFFNSRAVANHRALQQQFSLLDKNVQDAIKVLQSMQSSIPYELPPTLNEHPLGQALNQMALHLTKISAEEKERDWLTAGIALMGDILRNKSSLSLTELADQILLNLVKYLDANQGALFIADQVASDPHLRLIACYAYNRKKYLQKQISLGEGLAGQCFLERQGMYLREIPADYVRITSGLGDATPRSLLLSPLMVNDEILGVIELASLKEFNQNQIRLVTKVSEIIAATIKTMKTSERTVELLAASQQQTEELRAQEEEMRQNMEEMQATQEEMKRKSDELTKNTLEMDGLMVGINATMATIEFDTEGRIITANENFLSTMRYTLTDIQGKHHSVFVPASVQGSQEYQRFWHRLANGESFTGVFKRINSVGESVWLNAIYNPIRDERGLVKKVWKFAIDVTKQQEIAAENEGMLKGINATMAVIEFTPTGQVLYANDNFLNSIEYSLEEVKSKHHRMFVPADVLESMEYQNFWVKLAQGIPFTGRFKRITASGKTLWLDAIYNPIKNAEGKVIKVVKYATVVGPEASGNNSFHDKRPMKLDPTLSL